MTTRYGSTFTSAKSGTLPQVQPDSRLAGSKRRTITEVFDMSAQTIVIGDQLYIGTLPIGAVYEATDITTDTSFGSSTVAVGSASSSAKYGAAATLTATDTPTAKTKTSAKAQAPLTAPEDVYITIAAANMPTTGKFVSELRYRTAA